tara:strand:- start:175 stop:627 length:453 start_codon:yes stop_codon:yes gene_type:complete
MTDAFESFPGDEITLTMAADLDRTVLTARGEAPWRHLGIEGPDGQLLPVKGARGERCYLPLTMDDRFITWNAITDHFEMVRLGAMLYHDLLGAVHYQQFHASASMLGQTVNWLWWRTNRELQGNGNDATVETLVDGEGYDCLHLNWNTLL